MKYNLNFIQILNWIYVLKQKIVNLNIDKDSKDITIQELKKQQENLNKIKDILNKKIKLVGIQRKFLEEYKKMKRK